MLTYILDHNHDRACTQSNRGLGPWPFGGEKRVEEDAQLFLPETVRNTTKKMDFKEVLRVTRDSY